MSDSQTKSQTDSQTKTKYNDRLVDACASIVVICLVVIAVAYYLSGLPA